MELTITSNNGQSIPIIINIDCKTHHICIKEKKISLQFNIPLN